MLKDIKIEGLSQDQTQYGIKVVIQSGRDKYNFYSTKKDGNKTKAYEQLQQFRYQIGDTVKAEVAEEKKTFKDKKTGKDVTYTDRRILYFATVENTPVFEAPKKEIQTINIDEEIKSSDLPF